MNRPPFLGNNGGPFMNNGPNFPPFQNVTQNHGPPNQAFCQLRPPRQIKPNMVWNSPPPNNGPSNSGPDWRQNGPSNSGPDWRQNDPSNSGQDWRQNGQRTHFQSGPRMQVGARMNFGRPSGEHDFNRGSDRWQNGNGFNNQNLQDGWQNGNQINGQNNYRNVNQNRWGNGNQINSQNHRQTGNWNQNRQNGNWNQNRNNSKNKNKNKNKVNKRDLAEHNEYFCDPCDRGFKTEDKYQEHVSGHVKCSVEGCTYVAASKLVQLHYRLQHSTGLAKRIWQLESKEDVDKWRNERKRNYPTAENIARKKQILEGKRSRGEVLETKEFGKFKKRQPGRNRQGDDKTNDDVDERPRGKRNNRFNRRKRRNNRRNNKDELEEEGTSAKKSKLENEESVSCATDNLNGSCTKLIDNNEVTTTTKDSTSDPLSYVLNVCSSDSDGANADISKQLNTVIKADASGDNSALNPFKGGLGSILSMYGSDSDSDGEVKTVVEQTIECKSQVQKLSEKTEKTKSSPARPKPKKLKKKTNLFYRKRRMTLLEKLLANEIRQERNKILQCVHHIVKNKFYGIGQKPVQKSVISEEIETNTEDPSHTQKSVEEIKTGAESKDPIHTQKSVIIEEIKTGAESKDPIHTQKSVEEIKTGAESEDPIHTQKSVIIEEIKTGAESKDPIHSQKSVIIEEIKTGAESKDPIHTQKSVITEDKTTAAEGPTDIKKLCHH